MTPNEILNELELEINTTGNIADAVEEVTGARGWMAADMKPIFPSRIVGQAATVLMRPLLNNDATNYPNKALELLDEAHEGSILIYVMQDSVDIAAMGDLMGATAKIRGIKGAVIDGAVRDISQLKKIGFPVWSRRVTPASLVGRMVAVDKQVQVRCGDVIVNPRDYVICDLDGVVVIPEKEILKVIDKIRIYAKKEEKILEIILKEKSILKALEEFKRY
jgi:4-hydroxy-4-methyl-2-oxoglutarate aldolase